MRGLEVQTVAVKPGDLTNTPASFSAAKRILYDEAYTGHHKTFYCGGRLFAIVALSVPECALATVALLLLSLYVGWIPSLI